MRSAATKENAETTIVATVRLPIGVCAKASTRSKGEIRSAVGVSTSFQAAVHVSILIASITQRSANSKTTVATTVMTARSRTNRVRRGLRAARGGRIAIDYVGCRSRAERRWATRATI